MKNRPSRNVEAKGQTITNPQWMCDSPVCVCVCVYVCVCTG